MKTSTKITLSLVGIAFAIFLPTILYASLYIQLPGIVHAFLLIWMIYLLRYVWRLPSYQILTIKGHKDDQWGDNNSHDVIGLKSELLKLSNPNNFKNSFSDNTYKIVKSKKIIICLYKTDANDISRLKEIRAIAQNELGITINTLAFKNHLFDVFSPIKYKNKPKYINEMIRICSDIAECNNDLNAIECTIINTMERIAHWNSLADIDNASYKAKITRIFLWGIIGSVALCFLCTVILRLIIFKIY